MISMTALQEYFLQHVDYCDYSCIMFLSVFRSETFTAPGHPAGSLKKPPQHQDIQLKTTEPKDLIPQSHPRASDMQDQDGAGVLPYAETSPHQD